MMAHKMNGKLRSKCVSSVRVERLYGDIDPHTDYEKQNKHE